MPRTADFIAEQQSVQSVKHPKPKAKRKMHANSLKNLCPPWPKGFCANPGGQNQHDASKMISRMIFENNYQQVYEAQRDAVLSGNAYAFKEHAERAYGKLKEVKEVHTFQEVNDTDLQQRIDAIIHDLGLAGQIDAVGGVAGPEGRAEKANGEAKNTDVLSGQRTSS